MSFQTVSFTISNISWCCSRTNSGFDEGTSTQINHVEHIGPINHSTYLRKSSLGLVWKPDREWNPTVVVSISCKPLDGYSVYVLQLGALSIYICVCGCVSVWEWETEEPLVPQTPLSVCPCRIMLPVRSLKLDPRVANLIMCVVQLDSIEAQAGND